jgi:hypothetical protein
MRQHAFNEQELAMVLAGLRCLQANYPEGGSLSMADEYPHFDEVEPLSDAEIEALCERINCESEPLAQIQPETFPRMIELDEANRYNEIGQNLMLAAGPARLPEQKHARLCSIMIGMTTELVQTTHVPRQKFCNDLTSTVMLTALKAAYVEGGGELLDNPDGGST